MLVLSRKKNESIVIDGGIVIEVLQIGRDQIRVGVTAPAAVKVLRGELRPFSQQPAAPTAGPNLNAGPMLNAGPGSNASLELNGQGTARATQFVINSGRLETGRELPAHEIAVHEPELIFQTSSPLPATRGKTSQGRGKSLATRLVRCG
jgi:carbon storage regulator